MKLDYFDGFPYLNTRLAPCIYHIILLPHNLTGKELFDIGVKQAAYNRLETCLVLKKDFSFYFDLKTSSAKAIGNIPKGGIVLIDKLKPPEEVVYDGSMTETISQLKGFAYKHFDKLDGGAMFGDLTKGGQTTSDDILSILSGSQENGVPLGLTKCPECNYYTGECIDPSPQFKDKLMKVNCLCENDNRCALCGELLHKYKLNSNYYNERQNNIIHVPGFCCFEHKCNIN